MRIFKNRTEAGRELAVTLAEFRGTNAIILALPRGGIVVGAEIARELKLPLDIIVTRKIGTPENEEYAIGAIDVDGEGIWSDAEVEIIDKEWLEKKVTDEKKEALRRLHFYRGARGALNIAGQTAIIVDDGIATGYTMKAAVRYAEKLGSRKIVIAAPVAPTSVENDLKKNYDTRILETTVFFSSVGQWYEDFKQVSDKEVVALLQ